VYLDDPSILMPAPPPNLTAATGALVMDGRTSRRALTVAMLDLASRGLIAFRDHPGDFLHARRIGIDTRPSTDDPGAKANHERNRRRPIGPAEGLALSRLRHLALGEMASIVQPDTLPNFGKDVAPFNAALEQNAVELGWFRERPGDVTKRWVRYAIAPIVAGGIAVWAGFNIPFSGLTLLGGAAIGGGIALLAIARFMPAVTMPGAMIRAMLAAYRRTLQKTMAHARSLDQVVADAGLTWLDTPDQAVVWGTALGLQDDIEAVLDRSLQDIRGGGTMPMGVTPYFPAWWQTSSGQPFASAGMSSDRGSVFSNSRIPDIGGMMSALGTVGNGPSGDGAGGIGGFGGGFSGGGGGAGGGF
jgi:hypothetical protein